VGLDYFYYTAASWAPAGHNDIPYFTGAAAGARRCRWNTRARTDDSLPRLFRFAADRCPVGSGPAVPWRTLLFRPQVGHPGENAPEDELLLDWFWMPVVEPYAISTPFATAGKVNLNYQIAPFTYITRATALLGVLGSENVIAAPSAASVGYAYKSSTNKASYRYR